MASIDGTVVSRRPTLAQWLVHAIAIGLANWLLFIAATYLPTSGPRLSSAIAVLMFGLGTAVFGTLVFGVALVPGWLALIWRVRAGWIVWGLLAIGLHAFLLVSVKTGQLPPLRSYVARVIRPPSAHDPFVPSQAILLNLPDPTTGAPLFPNDPARRAPPLKRLMASDGALSLAVPEDWEVLPNGSDEKFVVGGQLQGKPATCRVSFTPAPAGIASLQQYLGAMSREAYQAQLQAHEPGAEIGLYMQDWLLARPALRVNYSIHNGTGHTATELRTTLDQTQLVTLSCRLEGSANSPPNDLFSVISRTLRFERTGASVH